MQRRLNRYIDDRSRILAAVSHDLKTPITRLRLRTEMLDDAELSARFKGDLDDMEAMIHATLEFMRGSENPEPLVAVDINALIDSLGEDMRARGRAFQRHMHAAGPYPGRPLALKRCLNNLLENALHYATGAIEVDVQDHRDHPLCVFSTAAREFLIPNWNGFASPFTGGNRPAAATPVEPVSGSA